MNPIVRNILAPIAGVILGSLANIALIMLGPSVVPLPEGINPMDPENLKANFHLLETRHFIFPFLAHAVGTLVGAFVAAKIAASRKMIFGIAIGAFFLGWWNYEYSRFRWTHVVYSP